MGGRAEFRGVREPRQALRVRLEPLWHQGPFTKGVRTCSTPWVVKASVSDRVWTTLAIYIYKLRLVLLWGGGGLHRVVGNALWLQGGEIS